MTQRTQISVERSPLICVPCAICGQCCSRLETEPVMMKHHLAIPIAAALSIGAFTPTDPRTIPTKLDPVWQAKTRALFKQVLEIPTVHNRGEVPRLANLLAARFKAAGIPAQDIRIM